MTRQELIAVARARGISVYNMLNENVIRRIQQKEGYDPCFATDKAGRCLDTNCLWQRDCLAYHHCFGSDAVSQWHDKNCLWYRDCYRRYCLNHNLPAPAA